MTETALKPFLTYEEQINNLVERKGMVISNRKYAFEKLEDISYFSLIDGYKNLFYNPMTRRYKPGTTFEDIVALYELRFKILLTFSWLVILFPILIFLLTNTKIIINIITTIEKIIKIFLFKKFTF